MDYKNGLNAKQFDAVTTSAQYCRVIAGAGSGKTRVLTFRIAFLIDQCHVNPRSILAITFTNKAANEMKERVNHMIPEVSSQVQLLTFHSFCARFLRREIQNIGMPQNFIILDEDDQKSIIRNILKEENLPSKDPLGKELPSYISSKKNLGLYPDQVVIKSMNANEQQLLKLYRRYEEKLSQIDALDFDDLLLTTFNILTKFENVRQKWQRYFSHILIDEFQDTNDIQYQLVKSLMTESTCLYVVGDPDQTIYTWRGANQDILLDLKNEYNIETITLEENYRSTKEILDLANRLIVHNKKRLPKELYTNNAKGEEIACKCFNNQYEEAQYVAREIKSLINSSKYVYSDIVVMYRTNYLTLPYEKIFTQEKIAYRIFGGQKFYQRKEIKDLLAYIRLLVNPKDDISLERIFNVPRRGIGDGTIEKLKEITLGLNTNFINYIETTNPEDTIIQKRQLLNMKTLVDFLAVYRQKMNTGYPFGKLLNELVEELNYYNYLKTSEENGDDRIENVKTLIDDVASNVNENSNISLEEYLQNISLMSSQDYVDSANTITMMTVHTAKGLEYPVVFLVSMNEGVFPSARSVSEKLDGLEEERRLCYVAYTRAMKKLYITSYFNSFRGAYAMPSLFIKESGLQSSAIKLANPSTIFDKNIVRKPLVSNVVKPHIKTNNIIWQVGDHLRHEKFGDGIVISANASIIEVEFKDCGTKKLLGIHPLLTALDREKNYEA